MANVVVHNISDRPNTEGAARAILIGGQMLRPGKYIEVDRAQVTRKLRQLHGTLLWFGTLPDRFTATSRAALRETEKAIHESTPPMEIAEVREHLEAAYSDDDLLTLGASLGPPLVLAPGTARVVVVGRLARALFQSGRIVDPSTFFWLRRWTRSGDVFLERE